MMAAAIMENLHGDKIQRVGRGGERVTEEHREGRGALRDKRKGSEEEEWMRRRRRRR